MISLETRRATGTHFSSIMILSFIFKVANSTKLDICFNIYTNSRNVHFVTMENTKDCLCKSGKLGGRLS
jgi:hypothetical protein